jgi:hypothetical protein
VKTPLGVARGLVGPGFFSFRGLPYAVPAPPHFVLLETFKWRCTRHRAHTVTQEPPVGNLRWQAPVPKASWGPNVLDASAFGFVVVVVVVVVAFALTPLSPTLFQALLHAAGTLERHQRGLSHAQRLHAPERHLRYLTSLAKKRKKKTTAGCLPRMRSFSFFRTGGTGAQLLPVILFIHGGAFVNGVPLVSCVSLVSCRVVSCRVFVCRVED